jgi:hypothetical protein
LETKLCAKLGPLAPLCNQLVAAEGPVIIKELTTQVFNFFLKYINNQRKHFILLKKDSTTSVCTSKVMHFQ